MIYKLSNHIRYLRNISIPPTPILLPLQELLLNQSINIPLNPTNLEHPPTPRRLDRLGHKLRMTNPLPRLQDAHNRSLRFVIAVRGDALVGFFVFGRRLFELDGVDFDAVFGVREGRVQGEGVGGADFARFGVFGQGADFGAGEGLEGAV
jgi:hypothetical protein